nr:hypothetical protein [Zobellella iuensis]
MKILFLCTHNACRSILAEALCRHLAGGRVEVASAGSVPAGCTPVPWPFWRSRA